MNNNNRKSCKRADLKQKTKSCCDPWSQSADPPLSSQLPHTACGISSVRRLVPFAVLSDQHRIRIGVVVVNHRFCLCPTKGVHTCVQVLRMQTLFLGFPWYTVRVASPHCVEQLRCCFTEGNSCFCLPMVPTRRYNTTI